MAERDGEAATLKHEIATVAEKHARDISELTDLNTELSGKVNSVQSQLSDTEKELGGQLAEVREGKERLGEEQRRALVKP